ncbi:hypothetical protein H4R33_006938 [Dimargaris cristalligena]|uniref:Secreted protein n=1 Tax=Dimargaris cristalligena TaxID=215637 RepID=A0A4P9ZU88_9FUNG|nr:hypothetical protein H4R33_006938 [Dimargaris cristalligena]RKP36798.1 hypothetical protein BJ085DRAFT_31104 [Dimargaris cristalligena]|eukprot:RKP36798.1 hypothetical protein BJ085DRAFT_31104 [Dimargaris cristalligena]
MQPLSMNVLGLAILGFAVSSQVQNAMALPVNGEHDTNGLGFSAGSQNPQAGSFGRLFGNAGQGYGQQYRQNAALFGDSIEPNKETMDELERGRKTTLKYLLGKHLSTDSSDQPPSTFLSGQQPSIFDHEAAGVNLNADKIKEERLKMYNALVGFPNQQPSDQKQV